jgi:hypothetical protein
LQENSTHHYDEFKFLGVLKTNDYCHIFICHHQMQEYMEYTVQNAYKECAIQS